MPIGAKRFPFPALVPWFGFLIPLLVYSTTVLRDIGLPDSAIIIEAMRTPVVSSSRGIVALQSHPERRLVAGGGHVFSGRVAPPEHGPAGVVAALARRGRTPALFPLSSDRCV